MTRKRPAPEASRSVVQPVIPLFAQPRVPALSAEVLALVLENLSPWDMFRLSQVSHFLSDAVLENVRNMVIFRLIPLESGTRYAIYMSTRRTQIVDSTSADTLQAYFDYVGMRVYDALHDSLEESSAVVPRRLIPFLTRLVAKMGRLEALELLYDDDCNTDGLEFPDHLLPTPLLDTARALPNLKHVTYRGISANPRAGLMLARISPQLQTLSIRFGAFFDRRHGLADAVWGMLLGALSASLFGCLRVLSIEVAVYVDAQGRDVRDDIGAICCVSFVDALADALLSGHGLRTLFLWSSFVDYYQTPESAFDGVAPWRNGALARLQHAVEGSGGYLHNSTHNDLERSDATRWYSDDLGSLSHSFSWPDVP